MPPSLTKHTITALYDTRDYADKAAAMLKQSGVPADDVSVSPENAGDDAGMASSPNKTGFWASLERLFGDTDDHQAYAEGVRRGGILLTAHVLDERLDRAVEILEQHGSIDLDERENDWRQDGWTGTPVAAPSLSGSAAAFGGATSLAMATRTRPMQSTGGIPAAPFTAPARSDASSPVIPASVSRNEDIQTAPILATAPMTAAERVPIAAPLTTPGGAVARGAEDVVQVVEERLNVGKRSVSRGKVRLHSYVVETPVTEQVSLHHETVTFDRHAVDRPVATLGADAFSERTIELEEMDEEAVVAKSARLVEEIGIRKDVSDRMETIHDSVRSTKVDIQDGRNGTDGKVGMTGTSVGAAGNLARLVKDMEVIGSDGRHVGTIDHVDGDTSS